MAKKGRYKKRNKVSTGRIYVAIIAMFMLIVMGVQISRLYIKDLEYKETQAALERQLEDAENRKEELKDLEDEVSTSEYIEKEARNKLGLTRDNEIIFRQE